MADVPKIKPKHKSAPRKAVEKVEPKKVIQQSDININKTFPQNVLIKSHSIVKQAVTHAMMG